MKPNSAKAILGGFVGTALITAMMYYMAPMMMGQPMDVARMIAGILGVSWGMGMLIHIINGTFIFPLLYVAFFSALPGSPWLRGSIWGIILWFLAMILFMPLAGMGVFAMRGPGMVAVMGSLMSHLVYGATLGAIAGGAETEIHHPGHPRAAG